VPVESESNTDQLLGAFVGTDAADAASLALAIVAVVSAGTHADEQEDGVAAHALGCRQHQLGIFAARAILEWVAAVASHHAQVPPVGRHEEHLASHEALHESAGRRWRHSVDKRARRRRRQ
jgi:hypothetical protein